MPLNEDEKVGLIVLGGLVLMLFGSLLAIVIFSQVFPGCTH